MAEQEVLQRTLLQRDKSEHRRWLLWIGGISALFLVALMFSKSVYAVGESAENITALEEAEAKWKAHPIRHYQLSVKYAGVMWAGPNFAGCEEEAEVIDEQETKVLYDTCHTPRYPPTFILSPITVSTLFKQLRNSMAVHGTPQEIMCDGVPLIDVKYEAVWGYPLSFTYHTKGPSPETLGMGTYVRMYGFGGTVYNCLAIGNISPPTTTVSLKELP